MLTAILFEPLVLVLLTVIALTCIFIASKLGPRR